MKANCNLTALRKCALLLVVILIAEAVFSQAPIYRFRNPTLISGTAGNVNAVYRFPNVRPSGSTIDALVRIQARVGTITLQNIDRTADGYDEAFQPEYRVGSLTDAYFEFLITFVQGGTSTPVSQPLVDVSGLDIDGSASGGGIVNLNVLKEFNRIDMGGGVCTFNTLGSQLTLSEIGTAYEGANFTGLLFGALVDTAAKEVMFSVRNANVTSFTYRVGANSLLSSSSTRYASLYFKRFSYPDLGVLSASNLSRFTGVADEDKVKLKWTLAEGNNASTIELEKSKTGNSFESIAQFWVNTDGHTAQRDFSYTDNSDVAGKVYYRLKITSANGKTQYSNIVHFDSKKAGDNTLTVYPSLVQSETTISLNSPVRENGMVIVADMSGRVVKQQTVVLQKGTNNILVPGFENFRKGNYIIAVNTPQQKLAKQIIVQ